MPKPKHGPASVEQVIVAPAPGVSSKARRAETEAFLALSQTLAERPHLAVQRLAETALKLTGADSSGISLQDKEGDEEVFRWVATAGEFSRYLHGTMPRHFSPCGTVLERRRTLVMREPVRHYDYIKQLHAPVHSALLAPFARRGKLVGTVWVLNHTPDKVFTQDDVRMVEGLTTFATSVLDAAPRAG